LELQKLDQSGKNAKRPCLLSQALKTIFALRPPTNYSFFQACASEQTSAIVCHIRRTTSKAKKMFASLKFALVIAASVFVAVSIAKPTGSALVDSTKDALAAPAFSFMMWYDGSCALIELGIGKIVADGNMCALASRQVGWTMRVCFFNIMHLSSDSPKLRFLKKPNFLPVWYLRS
jgi:hypothetical protein